MSSFDLLENEEKRGLKKTDTKPGKKPYFLIKKEVRSLWNHFKFMVFYIHSVCLVSGTVKIIEF